MRRTILVILACAAFTACATLTLAEKESPACSGLDSSELTADATFIAQLAIDIPAGNLGAILDAFVAAKGPAQFLCAEQMAEALLGNPVAPIDAGPPTLPANASPIEQALQMNHAPQLGALEKLQTYKSSRNLGPHTAREPPHEWKSYFVDGSSVIVVPDITASSP